MTYYITAKDPELGRIMKARSRLGSKAPGYAAQVFGLELVEHEGIDTMATDGKSIFWSRKFVQQIDDRKVMGVLFHEGIHVTCGHHLRRPADISPDLWNVACDFCVNIIVKDAGEILPENALYDDAYRGMTAVQVARKLKKKEQEEEQGNEGDNEDQQDDQQDGQQDGQDEEKAEGQPSNFDQAGEVWDATGEDGQALSQSDKQEAEEVLRRDVIVAAAVEKAAGSGSITIEQGILEAAKAAHVDWLEAMADFLDRSFGQEPTLAKPARRHLWRGDYFPTMKGVGGGDLVIAIDTSGSVSQAEAEQFASEIDGIRETIKPDRTCVIYCDSRIQKTADGDSYDEFDSYDDIEVRKISGGGTRFEPPFHLVDAEGLAPSAFIYFTDGYASVDVEQVEDKIDYPVLWATTGAEPSFYAGDAFGEIIEVTL